MSPQSAAKTAKSTKTKPGLSPERVLIGRIPVTEIEPAIDGGRWPAKAVVGEAFPISATVFREGHDALGASAVLVRPDGSVHSRTAMVDIAPGLDRFQAWAQPDSAGLWTFHVEGWSDPYATWKHDATIKVEAGIDVELMLAEGALVLDRAAAATPERQVGKAEAALLTGAARALRDTKRPPLARLAAGTSPEVHDALTRFPLRDMVSPSVSLPLRVERERALTGAWYEFFVRSEGASFNPESGGWSSGTLKTASARLPHIAAMGFDFLYLTPIHPIGMSNRKGRNNTLGALPGDPGSPYAIGAAAGGHDAIEPTLGTFADFDNFVASARELGLEVALDLALQCSPDHPWVTEHPEWFTTRADGSIAYAENPPKKYQDIYPLNFDNDPEGIYQEINRILRLWISHGVTAFRVDNPHTKPLAFWERTIADINADFPDVIFLAEAFTKPAMMRTLGEIGFQQSYTYFTWRTTRDELAEYFDEVSNKTAHLMRPSFWPTTHDILTPYMQSGNTAAFKIRAILAATGSPTWGIYSGYELHEHVARPGAEEQIDNEKYEFKARDWSRAAEFGIEELITKLNAIRRAHPALQRLRGVRIHETSNEQILCFSKHVPAEFSPTGEADTVIVVVNLDQWSAQESMIYVDPAALGLSPTPELVEHNSPIMAVHDELTGETYAWATSNYVRLDPSYSCAHVLSVRRP